MADSEEYKRQREEIEKTLAIQEKMRAEGNTLFSIFRDVLKQKKLIVDQEKKHNKLKKLQKDIDDEINSLNSSLNTLTGQAADDAVNKIYALEEEREILKKNIKQHDKIISQHKVIHKLMKSESVSAGLLVKLTGRALLKGLKATRDIYREQDEAVRETGRSMGILRAQSEAFAMNIFKASLNTNMLSVQAKDLAKMQGIYSSELGRNIVLSERGLVALAEMSEGTSLGSEGAAQMAVSMNKFGLSAEMSRDAVQDMLNSANEMGVNADASIGNLQKNLKIAQRYNFKDGMKGIKEMSLYASKFKVDMESIAGIADKVMDVEGAVEMAANLQVLGGEWAKLGDPFKLMYQATNDIGGLAKSFTQAAASTARFNEKTGEFDITGLELRRLGEISKLTGQSVEELTDQARLLKKDSVIKMSIDGDIEDEKLREFITTTATLNKKGQAVINIDGKDTLVKALSPTNINYLNEVMNSKSTLAERAKDAKSFDETVTNLMNTFKSLLLPFARGLDEGLRVPIQELMGKEGIKDFGKHLLAFGKFVGELVGGIASFVVNNPIKTLVSALTGWAAIKFGTWVANGIALAIGFNRTANLGGAGGGFGGVGGVGGVGGGPKPNLLRAPKGGVTVNGKFYKGGQFYNSGVTQPNAGVQSMGKLGKFGKGLGRIGKGLGKASLPLALLGVGVDAFSNLTDDKLSTGDALTKTLDQHKFMAMGAAIGSIVPGIGTLLGAGIGGIADMFAPTIGDYEQQDFVMRPGEGAVPFSSKDTLVGAKPGGPIDKMLDGTSDGSSKSPGIIDVNFSKPLEIRGEINLISNGQSTPFKLDDPIFVREITKIINEQLRKSGTGILNPTPRA